MLGEVATHIAWTPACASAQLIESIDDLQVAPGYRETSHEVILVGLPTHTVSDPS